jgi:MFS family permease
MLRSLRHPNFRLFLLGQIISLTGTWMQEVALSWLVYRLTHSAFLLGAIGFASHLPSFLLALFGGVLADRANRHRTLMVTQALLMAQALSLWALVATDHIGVPSLLALTALLGAVTGLDMPVRQAFLVDMVSAREDLPNAIALNSSVFNAARLVGPALAGLLIHLTGEAGAFLLNGLSYIAVIAALMAMRLPPGVPRHGEPPAITAHLREGLGYAFGFSPIRSILLLIALVSLVGVPFMVLMPVFAVDVLHGGPGTLGALMGAVGLGALAAALFLASRRTVLGLGRFITGGALLIGAGSVGFSMARHLAVAVPLLFVAGFGMMVLMASSNTILQTIVEDDKRGRVMSLYTMSFMGTLPIGCLLSGLIANHLGAPQTVRIGGALCILGALCFARGLPTLRAKVRPLYLQLGLLPEAAPAVENVALEDAAGQG